MRFRAYPRIGGNAETIDLEVVFAAAWRDLPPEREAEILAAVREAAIETMRR